MSEKEDLKKEAKEIASVIFGVPVERIKDATWEEPVLADKIKRDLIVVRELLDKKILDELSKTV